MGCPMKKQYASGGVPSSKPAKAKIDSGSKTYQPIKKKSSGPKAGEVSEFYKNRPNV